MFGPSSPTPRPWSFVGVDTLFGPLYLAYGQAQRGNHAFYFYLGRGS